MLQPPSPRQGVKALRLLLAEIPLRKTCSRRVDLALYCCAPALLSKRSLGSGRQLLRRRRGFDLAVYLGAQ
jgi:hypothetical protein